LQCRTPTQYEQSLVERLGPGATAPCDGFRAVGCSACRGTGYAGRTALLEIMEVTTDLQRAMLTRPDAASLEQAAVGVGMETLLTQGLTHVAHGTTTLEEVLRVTRAAA